MSWHGVDAVDDAIDATRGFLFPVTFGRWARIAVVSLFVGGGGGGGQLLSNAGNFTSQFAGSGGLPSDPGPAGAVAPLLAALPALGSGLLPSDVPALVGVPALQAGLRSGALGALGLAIVAGVALLVIGGVLLSPLFEFVLVDAVARDDVRLLRDLRTHLGNGLRYLGFRIGLAAAFVVPPAAVVAAAALSGTSPERLASNPAPLVGLALLAVLYLLVYVLIARLTREFVVPAMVADGGGVIDNWRRVWPLLRGQPWQTLVYLLMHALVGIGVSIVSAVLVLLGLLVVAVIAGVVGLAVGAISGGVAGGDSGLAVGLGVGWLAAAVVGVPLFLLAVVLPVRVATMTFSRAYELASLGRFSDGLDLVDRYRDDEDDERDAGDDDGDDRNAGGDGDGGDDEDGDDDGDNVGSDPGSADGWDAEGEFGGFVPATDPEGGADDDGRSDRR